MNSEEYKRFWGRRLRVWDEATLERTGLSLSTREFMTRTGLPENVDWTLTFCFDVVSSLDLRPNYWVFGNDGDVPLCVDDRTDRVLCAESVGDELRYVNNSISSFAWSATIFQEYREAVRGMNDEDAIEELISSKEARMRAEAADSFADPDGYWTLIFEQMYDGLL